MNVWIILLLAEVLEIGWAIGLKYIDAFTKFWPSVWTVFAYIASIGLLAIAVRQLPIGTAYPDGWESEPSAQRSLESSSWASLHPFGDCCF
ncbi:Quaternary ammonium compound-resistance protein SugE [Novipirellula aureliae]|uniref:Guanidinium exporter n=1 Tax=Novipirellula aureliae TaxID=2527966 RepID=A0A5C6DTI3_9BACT|nr:SMR family transporter [Novipirellula aureliae]TWU40078.1 Quaternary ammonium compound-resistance protein SugE [Novipirellula aureliae]